MTITVIIPVYNAQHLLSDTLRAINTGTRLPEELIVVDDGSTDQTSAVAAQHNARVEIMPRNLGPAACRNHAALLARGDILVFLDADTCVHPDTLARMEHHLAADPTLAAVIGAYDETPTDRGLCSQFRNLAHCFVHRSASRHALTFWSGCGAIRRQLFLDADGFDERYRRPSVEDIELGYRMTSSGAKILLEPSIRVTHTKRWNLLNAIRTDVWDRGLPWMALLLDRHDMPNDLNLSLADRAATALTAVSILCLGASLRSSLWLITASLCVLVTLACKFPLLLFVYRERGLRILPTAAFMILLQYACNVVSVTGGALMWFAHIRRITKRHPISRIADLRRAHPTNLSGPVHLP